jgi:AraC-like DNA-binding protein
VSRAAARALLPAARRLLPCARRLAPRRARGQPAAVQRAPHPALRPFVKTLWASASGGSTGSTAPRELVLPGGTTHIVFRGSGPPLRVFDGLDDPDGRLVGRAVVGAARASYYVRDVSRPSEGVGAELRPGAAGLLLGVPAGALGGRHASLVELLGRSAEEALERVSSARTLEARLDALESFLLARLSRLQGPPRVHPVVAGALEVLARRPDVSEAVRLSGYSHRRFVALFEAAVGLTPKLYCRVARFQALLASGAAGAFRSWGDAAIGAGYFDQPHLHRDFLAFAGMPPGRYRELSPAWSRHVPAPIGSNLSKTIRGTGRKVGR